MIAYYYENGNEARMRKKGEDFSLNLQPKQDLSYTIISRNPIFILGYLKSNNLSHKHDYDDYHFDIL